MLATWFYQQCATSPISFLLLVLLTALTVHWLRDEAQRRKWLPPGPSRIPVFGNLLALRHDPLGQMKTWQKRYGDVFTVQLGQQTAVCINGAKTIHSALNNNGTAFAGRPYTYITHKLLKGNGIVSGDFGDAWKQHRVFASSVLYERHNLINESGQDPLEVRVHDELEHLTSHIDQTQDRPLDVHIVMGRVVANNMCRIMFGHRIEYEDDSFNNMLHLVRENFENAGVATAFNFLPFSRLLPSKLWQNASAGISWLSERLEERKRCFNPDSIQCLVDAYLLELHKTELASGKDNNNNDGDRTIKWRTFNEDHLIATLQDTFLAGSETLATAFSWAFVYMAAHPDIQQRAQRELDNVLGSDRWPTMSDTERLAYTHAICYETLRCGVPAPPFLPHKTTRDVTIEGLSIPQGTYILTNIWSALHDERYWGNPAQFDPNHFLDSDGKLIKDHIGFIPWSTGRRQCIGKKIADDQFVLLMAAILHRYEIYSLEPIHNLQGIVGMAMHAPKYPICVRWRQQQLLMAT